MPPTFFCMSIVKPLKVNDDDETIQFTAEFNVSDDLVAAKGISFQGQAGVRIEEDADTDVFFQDLVTTTPFKLIDLYKKNVSLYFSDDTQYNTTSNGWVTIFDQTLSGLPFPGRYLVFWCCEVAQSDKQKDQGTRVRLDDTTINELRDGLSTENNYMTRMAFFEADLTTSSRLRLDHGQTNEGGTGRTRRIRFFLVRIDD